MLIRYIYILHTFANPKTDLKASNGFISTFPSSSIGTYLIVKGGFKYSNPPTGGFIFINRQIFFKN